MSPIYLNPQTSSPIPFLELKGDQQHNFQVFSHVHDHDLATSSNNSCLSYNNSHNSHSSQETLSFDYSRHAHSKVEKLVVSHEKTSELGQPYSSWLQSTVGDNSGCSYDYSFHLQGVEKIEADDDVRNKYDDDDHHHHNQNYNKYSKKWKPSKVRVMQKMMTSSSKNSGNSTKQQLDHLPKQQRQNNGDGIRVCSDCHTTTTPLWRSGPQGPKSLCNACGIRQRKARRAAMAAATAAGFGNEDAMATPPVPRVEARKSANKAHDQMKPERGLLYHDNSHTLPIKKRSKLIDFARNNNYNNNYKNNNYSQNSHNNNNNNNYSNNDEKKLCYDEDIAMSSSKDYSVKPNNPKRASFPRDEEEGAILLMALSCGLACSS